MAGKPNGCRKVIQVIVESQSESQLALSRIQILSVEYRLSEMSQLRQEAEPRDDKRCKAFQHSMNSLVQVFRAVLLNKLVTSNLVEPEIDFAFNGA